jgi:hypothetical protein
MHIAHMTSLHVTTLRATVVLVLLSSLAATVPARAEAPWGPRAFCTIGGKDTGTELPNCYYYTFEQCLATARGNGQSCMANPYYTGAAASGQATTRKRRSHAK